MGLILADTAAWVEYDRSTGSPVDRRVVDCMIAGIARRAGAALLAHDMHLARIATVMGIELDDASMR